MSSTISIQKYTDKSIVIRGDTKARLADIKAISGAKFGYYGGEAGWMFPLTMESQVRASLGIRSAYVSGPSPIKRESIGTATPYVPSSQEVSPAHPAHATHTTSVVAPVRGKLRGAVIDPDESDHKVFELLAIVEALRERMDILQTQFNELSAKFDELTVVEADAEEADVE